MYTQMCVSLQAFPVLLPAPACRLALHLPRLVAFSCDWNWNVNSAPVSPSPSGTARAWMDQPCKKGSHKPMLMLIVGVNGPLSGKKQQLSLMD